MIIAGVEKTSIGISKMRNHFICQYQSSAIPFLIRIGLIQCQERQDQTSIILQISIVFCLSFTP